MKIYQTLFLAAAIATNVAAMTTQVDATRPSDATGRPSDATGRPSDATGRPSGKPKGTKDVDATRPSGATGRPSGKPKGTKDVDATRPSGATGRPSGKPKGTKDVDATRPSGGPDRTKPKKDRPDEPTDGPAPKKGRPDCQKSEGVDARTTKYCCLKGKFTGEDQCPDGDNERLPAKCGKKSSTTMAAENTNTDSIVKKFEKALECRPIRTKKKEGEGNGNDESGKGKPQPEDPRRNIKSLADTAKDLSADGKKCVRDLKRALETAKTLVQQWKGEPTRKPRKDAAELEKDSVADTFSDAVDVAVDAEKIRKDFEQENIEKTTEDLLPVEEGDEDAPKECKEQWKAFKEELGAVVKGFKQLPTKLKTAKVKSVKIALKDIDLGDVDWSNEENVCSFSKALVSKMKEVQESVRARLGVIRSALCEDASKLANGPKVGELAGCLREKRKTNADDADREAADDKVYSRVRGKTNKIFAQLQKRCVAKKKKDGDDNDDDAEAVRPSAKTKRTMRMRIKKACADDEDKQECKDRVRDKIKEACKKKNPDAEVEVGVTDDGADTGGRRLGSDEALAAEVTVTQTGAQPNPDYEGGVAAALGSALVEVTADGTEGTESIIAPSQLPDIGDFGGDDGGDVGGDDDDTKKASAGSVVRVALGAAATAVVALVSMLF